MRYFKRHQTTLSEDTTNQPKDIRFSQGSEDILDTLLLKDGGGDTKTFPIGTHSIDLGQISEGRWLYVKASEEITVRLDGSEDLILIANKPTEMWVKYTSLDIVTTIADTRITVATAGE